MHKDWLIGLGIVFLTLGFLHAWEDAPALKRYAFEERHMGTLFRLVFYAPSEEIAQKAAKATFARIAELDQIMSDYKDDSELMLLCKKAGGDPVSVSDDLLKVLQASETVSKESQGAFDVTIGPVVRLWRRARRTRELPPAIELQKALSLVDYHNIQIDAEKKSVRLTREGILIDLGGIAKGYAAEAALAVLRRFGITRALVAAGGDIAVAEAPPDAPGWKVAIGALKNPEKDASAYLALANAAISTSGDAEQFVNIEGKRYAHHVDPKTGLGLVGRRSVSVIAPGGTLADGWGTAICVLGLDRGKALLESKEGYAGYLIFESERGLETTTTKNFERFRWKEK